MKKQSICLLLLFSFFLFGCAPAAETEVTSTELQSEILLLTEEISHLEEEKASLEKEIENMKTENDLSKYILTINIKQSHLSLDLSQHLKDELNDVSIQIPVDKEYYDSLEIGDVISDEFRLGSLLLHGSWGNWEITVENKEII